MHRGNFSTFLATWQLRQGRLEVAAPWRTVGKKHEARVPDAQLGSKSEEENPSVGSAILPLGLWQFYAPKLPILAGAATDSFCFAWDGGLKNFKNTADSEAETQEVRCCVLFFSRPGPLEGVRSKGKRFLFLEATWLRRGVNFNRGCVRCVAGCCIHLSWEQCACGEGSHCGVFSQEGFGISWFV